MRYNGRVERPLDLVGVLELLEAGSLVVMPSLQAAREIEGEYGRRRRASGLQAWEPPLLFSWQHWLESLWHSLTLEGVEGRVLLNRLQEEVLWADLASSAGVQAGTSATAREFARQARSALALAVEHQVLDRLEAAADTPDSVLFAAWYRLFQDHCRKHRLLPRALLPQTLREALSQGCLPAPSSIYMVGFDLLSPLQNSVLETLSGVGCAIHLCRLQRSGNAFPPFQGSSRVPGGSEAELQWSARWLSHFFTQPLQANQPTLRAAIVLPDPEANRALLEPLLRNWLAPELEAVSADLSSTPWRFSTGTGLAKTTIIAHALSLLHWIVSELSVEAIGTLLLSPYLEHSDELEQRVRFETQVLRRSALIRPELTLSAFLTWATGSESGQRRGRTEAALTVSSWRQLQRQHRQANSATYGEWTKSIRQALHTVGWPGPRPLSPSDFRRAEAWDSLLDLLATLDLHGARVSFAQALETLTFELQSALVLDGEPDAMLQILSASKTEGRLFDATLVVQATDAAWPLPESPHPLLGWSLQTQHHLPGTDTARTLERSQELLRALGERSSTLLLLTADHDDAGPLRLTALAQDLGLDAYGPEVLLPAFPQPAAAFEIEAVADDAVVPALPSTQIAGGARVLELQANCGFRAFATLRLGAQSPEARQFGFDPRESGQNLHKALELLWSSLKTRADLAALSLDARRAAVFQAVQEALRPHRRAVSPGDRWSTAYLDIAERRLGGLVLRWLEEELKREDFTVLTQEEKQMVSVGPLQLSVRPDRIDSVEGGLVFVDYKTSAKLSSEDWLGDRPSAPQLPLYSLLAEPGSLRGLAFGQLRAGDAMGWISLQAAEGLFPAKRGTTHADLADQVDAWREELTRLASEFAAGAAFVDPKSYPHTCQYCQQRLLCRVDPQSLLMTAVPAPDSDAEDEELRAD